LTISVSPTDVTSKTDVALGKSPTLLGSPVRARMAVTPEQIAIAAREVQDRRKLGLAHDEVRERRARHAQPGGGIVRDVDGVSARGFKQFGARDGGRVINPARWRHLDGRHELIAEPALERGQRTLRRQHDACGFKWSALFDACRRSRCAWLDAFALDLRPHGGDVVWGGAAAAADDVRAYRDEVVRETAEVFGR
jgi:hypothetical protein